mmetsp:Transcript_56469/g.183482  ORF Transcript_56469/g.183482 Transcript_56469/m.183482 type:complete len:233 (-) Transcript_56469:1708-2406(-)
MASEPLSRSRTWSKLSVNIPVRTVSSISARNRINRPDQSSDVREKTKVTVNQPANFTSSLKINIRMLLKSRTMSKKIMNTTNLTPSGPVAAHLKDTCGCTFLAEPRKFLRSSGMSSFPCSVPSATISSMRRARVSRSTVRSSINIRKFESLSSALLQQPPFHWSTPKRNERIIDMRTQIKPNLLAQHQSQPTEGVTIARMPCMGQMRKVSVPGWTKASIVSIGAMPWGPRSC